MKSLATSLFVLAVARFAAACAPREPAPPPPPLPPIQVIAEAPPDAIACSRVRAQLAAGAPKLRARLAFAGCTSFPCTPCPRDVACSPCQQGYCTFVGDTPAEAACELRVLGVSSQCHQMIPGTVYVTELEGVGYGYGAACWELAGAPRVDLDAAHAASLSAPPPPPPPPPGSSSSGTPAH